MAIDDRHSSGFDFSADVRETAQITDVVLLGLVPAVLAWMFTLPPSVKRDLAFEYTDPTLVTAFTASFVHLDPGHLFVNLAGYLLIVPVVYLLSVLGGQRQRFFAASLTFLFVFPVVLSYLNAAVLGPALSLGFSGVLMAFVGYLPIALAGYLDEQFDLGPVSSLAPVFFFAGFAFISLLSVRSVVEYRLRVVVGTTGLALAAVLMALLYLLAVVDDHEQLWTDVRAVVHRPGYFELFFVATVLFALFPFAAFPPDPATSGAVLNFYAHLLGYALGFIVSYATLATTERLPVADPLG